MPFYGFEEVFAIAISDREPLAPDPDFLILDEVYMKRVDDIGFVDAVENARGQDFQNLRHGQE